VHDIELTEDLSQVALILHLEPAAEGLCRQGSRFWVVRPQMGLDSVQGLETIVGARYLSVLPGPIDNPEHYEFIALAEPPVPVPIEESGLELAFEAPSRFNLVPGAQITYRGVPIGFVLDVELASDATSVEVPAYILPDYAELVRDNSWFWNTGGLRVNLALTEGLTIEMDSLRSLVVGGIALATPTDAGKLVSDGHRFFLHGKAHEDAASWRPALAVGDVTLPQPTAASRPPLFRASLSWREGKVFKTKKQRTGWVLSVEGGLLGPADLLVMPEEAIEEGATLQLGDRPYPLEILPGWVEGSLAFLPLTQVRTESLSRADAVFGEPLQGCLVYAAEDAPPLAISAARLTPTAGGWHVDDDLTIEPSWHGAAVLGRRSGRVIGVLTVSEDDCYVVPLPARKWGG